MDFERPDCDFFAIEIPVKEFDEKLFQSHAIFVPSLLMQEPLDFVATREETQKFFA